jgi:hypothetical protein
VLEVLPTDLHSLLVPGKHSTTEQAAAIHRVLGQSREEIAGVGHRLRDLVVREHSIERLFDRVLEEVGTLLGDRS